MRDSLNYNVLPVVPDNMACFEGAAFRGLTSMNAYYGYQATPLEKMGKVEGPQDVPAQPPHPMETDRPCRKRPWGLPPQDYSEFKKRRQNESSPFIIQQQSAPSIRKPTHNIPDMPRCIMGHYI